MRVKKNKDGYTRTFIYKGSLDKEVENCKKINKTYRFIINA